MSTTSILTFLIFPLLLASSATSGQRPRPDAVRDVMRKATMFMMDSVSDDGGFVWKYSLDRTVRYGEVKARKTMVWFEPPGTSTVGEMLLEAWQVTGDPYYRRSAERVAEVVLRGQLSCGGWHYFFDSDREGMLAYYREYLATIWGWEEHTHFYDNATFDDETTVSATRFLLRLSVATKDVRYHHAALRALEFIISSQLPNGGWPQRAPALYNIDSKGTSDYTTYATFNDDVIHNNIMMLLEASRTLNEQRYYHAALRGMEFFIISQLSAPQAGWAQQYDASLKPAPGRRFELGTVCSGETVANIEHLFDYYRLTGDRRFLTPIPPALAWLSNCAGQLPTKDYSHTYYYEIGTNRPIYTKVITKKGERSFLPTHDFYGAYPYGHQLTIDIASLQHRYDRIVSLDSAVARIEIDSIVKSQRQHPVINIISAGLDYRTTTPNNDECIEILESLDAQGGWIVENTVLDDLDFIQNTPLVFRGYDTGTYVTKMYRLINYLRSH